MNRSIRTFVGKEFAFLFFLFPYLKAPCNVKILPFIWLFLTASNLWSQSLHLGSQNLYTQGKSVVEVPLFVTNFDHLSLTQIECTVHYDPAALRLDSANPGENLPPGWVLNTNPSSESIRLTFSTSQGGLTKNWEQMGTLSFTLLSLASGDSTSLSIQQPRINDNDQLNPTSGSFVLMGGPSAGKGDLDGDSLVTFDDVQTAFNRLTNQQSVTDSVMEISGTQPLGMHDVALLYRHTVGLFPNLPNPPLPAKQDPDSILSDNAQVALQDPVHIVGDLYRYEINGGNLGGLLSADLELQVDTDVFSSIQGITAWTDAALVAGSINNNRLDISLASPSPFAGTGAWITLVVQHKPGVTESGLALLEFPFMNEGSIREIVVVSAKNASNLPRSYIRRGNLYLENARDYRKISLYTLQGKKAWQRSLTSSSHHAFSLKGLSSGTYLLILDSPTGQKGRIISLPRY